MNRVLITGGAGFLGSHLRDRLVRDGRDVLCVNNFFTGSKVNIARLIGNPYFKLMRHDVTLPRYVKVDQIYNLACLASPIHSQFDPVQTTKAGMHGAINMLGLAKRVKARVFQAPPRKSMAIRKSIPNPKATGAASTPSIRASARTRESFAGVTISLFYGDGSQTCSFCSVDGMIEGFVRMMESEPGFTGPVNLGNPGEFTKLELAENVLRLTGSRSKRTFKPLPTDDPRQRQPDITLAKAKLDWEPNVPLEDGLKEIIAYFRKPRNA